MTEEELRAAVRKLLAGYDLVRTPRPTFRGARFDAGLAWVYFPLGLGGLGAPRAWQPVVDAELAAAGAREDEYPRLGVGLGIAAPTILRYGTDEQRHRFLRPLWTGEEVWCQLFSEPGAGSDLAGLATRAVRDGDGWVVNGQKIWTALAHQARWGILLARTDPDVPKHRGLTYFICDMAAPGVVVRPLRQLTGEAEFNEVLLTDVRLPDGLRLGEVGDGWNVARTTLMNERVAVGARPQPREGGLIGVLADTWRRRPELRTPGAYGELLRLWVEAEAARLAVDRLRQHIGGGHPGPDGSAAKIVYARLNQQITSLELELLGEDGLRHDEWTMSQMPSVDFLARSPGHRYLRVKANSMEGGTSEILRNVIAERVLGLPAEPRVDVNVPWKDLPK